MVRARGRGERSRTMPLAVMFLGLGAMYWYLGVPLWVQILNGLVWIWAEYGARRLAAERRVEPLVGGEVLEKLRWELTRRERALEVSWPWDFAPMIAAQALLICALSLKNSSWGWLTIGYFLVWFFQWLERKRDRLELRMELAALKRRENATSRLI